MSVSRSGINFDANVALLWPEVPFLERFDRAKRAGLDAVEFWWPAGEDLSAVRAAIAESGLTVALFNFDAGDMAAGERGLLSIPDRQAQFFDNVPVALELAEQVGCRQLNALLGLECTGLSRDEQLELAVENLRRTARAAAAIGAKVLVEAVNTIENGPYLISHTADAAALIERVAEPNVAIQYDAYHMQRMEGNLAATIRAHAEAIAHIQIADSPGRGEPGTGEINFPYLFGVLREIGYPGHVGLEYRPTTTTTEASLQWMQDAVEK
jgi:hydroxypyruvate isomerase